jgi:NAD(P)-dependent dehydrogenase (short-subunit alcohol dehydrogenase family)
MDLGLHNKHAIVTGGSRGIGKAIARELAREGADVAIVARNTVDLQATARELAAETNRRIVPLAADVTSKEQVDRMVADAATQLGGLPSWSTAGPRQAARRPRPARSKPWSTRI